MPHGFKRPRILFVTPEVSYLPAELCAIPDTLRARAGDLGDFSAALISALYEKGADVHVTFPDYRALFNNHENPAIQTRLTTARRLNSPDPSRLPETNTALIKNYNEKNHVSGKKANKRFLQKRLGILKNPDAPVFFWPSYLDRMQNSFELIKSVLTDLLFKYPSLEILVAANGTFQTRINDIVRGSHLNERVAVFRPEDTLSHIAYGASDFILIPSASESVSFVEITGLLHGALPITRHIGSGHDFITLLDMDRNKGNGFLFSQLNYHGLSTAVDRALGFYDSPGTIKSPRVHRIMKNSRNRFNSSRTAEQYIALYEKMMKRQFIHT
jgi:glycogen synthase